MIVSLCENDESAKVNIGSASQSKTLNMLNASLVKLNLTLQSTNANSTEIHFVFAFSKDIIEYKGTYFNNSKITTITTTVKIELTSHDSTVSHPVNISSQLTNYELAYPQVMVSYAIFTQYKIA